MKLNKLLDLNKGDIVSIVGAGGKTTLMFSLAEELRYSHKVLVTTTTKIYIPNKKLYDFTHMSKNENKLYINSKSKGTYLLGSSVNEENKIIGVNFSYLDNIYQYFDYILIEADGSKKKPIKAWRKDEPVVYAKTNKTIGVLDITVVGKLAKEVNVHRLDKFIMLTNADVNKPITINHLFNLICHPEGLFKNSFGEKILFINKVENSEEILLANNLLEMIRTQTNFSLSRIISGSLLNKNYKKYPRRICSD
ncbi:selenium cofactor biosynthesis protein YqeC [Clostridium sp. CX1]|uniref:Selenium cofactor biosynthesis protein YqeC n=1 Tax=Clostridium tanneri TaxID=3037988 RepID=A0ABU4JTZ1_9CLOT|nr:MULTISPECIES: selenium cofactor biosynthesis protein YqeC [unclassified Clostridium]MCT8977544.1 selenium cofactor biosynthesis protein YqeC [Clostridium sp. CX1]MDW8801617.1 selenium cofactor biosynthesis protein YqeC [Clostridium sp. A1-XYC3]